MESSQNSLTIEQYSQEYKADLLVVVALPKEKKLLQKVFDVE